MKDYSFFAYRTYLRRSGLFFAGVAVVAMVPVMGSPLPGAYGNYNSGCFTDDSIYVSGGKYWELDYSGSRRGGDWKYKGLVKRINGEFVVITPDQSQPPKLYWASNLRKDICGR